MKNPIQPLMKDATGVVRFKGNAIVQHLLDTHPTCDMNRLARMDFTDSDTLTRMDVWKAQCASSKEEAAKVEREKWTKAQQSFAGF